MANKFNSFFDSVAAGALNPKGNLADYQHAARLYTDDNMRLAPKSKFTYHVAFEVSRPARGLIPKLFEGSALNEIGMLVKSVDLPKYSANVETKKKYNRVKNVQTGIKYDPINITFHDDNQGLTTALIQAYYRYYFADGNNRQVDSGAAYKVNPANTYEGTRANQYNYGMDVNNPGVPFFTNIKISIMGRGEHVTYTIVNPILLSWQHDTLNNADGAGIMQNQIEVAYEAVYYSAGNVDITDQGDPIGFGQDHYDRIPGPLSIAGGSVSTLGGVISQAQSLYQFIASGDAYNNPLLVALMGVNLFNSARGLSKEGLRQEGFNILTGALGNATGINVSGVAQTFFPKSGGNGGLGKTLLAGVAVGLVGSAISKQALKSNPAALASAMEKQYIKDYQSSNGGSVSEARNAYQTARGNPNQMTALENKVLGT